MADENNTHQANPQDLKPGPIRHEALTDKQLERVRLIYACRSVAGVAVRGGHIGNQTNGESRPSNSVAILSTF
jgi:hypothetical protein